MPTTMRRITPRRRAVTTMSDARKVTTTLKFNGDNVTTSLADYLESVTYEDVASGSSDSLEITLQNIDEKWLNGWYPTKGDTVSGKIKFADWDTAGTDLSLSCGTFTLDEIKFYGNSKKAVFSCLSSPAKENFKSRSRTKTWESITIKNIAKEIANRYSLSLSYSGSTIKITEAEQNEADSEFLYNLCEDYGLAMKVYKSKIVIYDQTTQEKTSSIATLKPASFVDNDWTLIDSIYGTYTGARISYKSSTDDDEISVYLGLKKETASGARVLRLTETASSASDAYYKAAAAVNLSNQEATTLTGSIWPNPKIVSGVCVKLSGFGELDGKYFVDKSTTEVGGSGGTKQKVELHKCQKRLTYKPTSSSKSSSSSSSSKTYKVGDIVTFNGGTHYVSSYSGSKGYTAKAGPAKITIIKSGRAHPYHLIHTTSKSNVYGWVDEGTFS